MTTKEAFYSIEISDTALAAMAETLGKVDVPGLQAWYRELDEENVRDLCASYHLWLNSQSDAADPAPVLQKVTDIPPETPEHAHAPETIHTTATPANSKRLRIRFKAPRLRRAVN